jgi:hypothetical protein
MHKNIRDALCTVAMLAVAIGLIWAMKLFSELANKPPTGDLATWAGAFGATAAALAAVWIALHQHAVQRRTEYTKAVIVAARVVLPLSSAEAEISKQQRWFDQMQLVDFNEAAMTNIVKAVRALKIPIEQDSIFYLPPLGDRCSYRIAAAVGTLEAVKASLPEQLGLYLTATSREERISSASFWSLCLNECVLNLKRASIECQRASHGLTSPNY